MSADSERTPKAQTTVDDAESVENELLLGLAPQNAALVLEPSGRRTDLNPWLRDCFAVKVSCLGHQEEEPRPWDWENVLTLLEPGEELLYVLDHVRNDGSQTGRPFTLWLAMRFPHFDGHAGSELDRRGKRARMVVSQFQRQAFPGSRVEWVDPSEVHLLLGLATGGEPRCVGVSGLPSSRELEDDKSQVDRRSAKRSYQSLNDVAESLVDLGCDYRISFVVGRVADQQLRSRLGQVAHLRDRIHPLLKRTQQSGVTEGTSGAVTDATTKADQKGKSSSNTIGASLSGTIGMNGGWSAIVVSGGTNASVTAGASWSRTSGTSESTTSTVSHARMHGTSHQTNRGVSVESINSALELADRALERTAKSIYEAYGTGGYRWAAFVFADGRNADLAAGALSGVLAGSRTKDSPLIQFSVVGATNGLLSGTESLLDMVAPAAPIISLSRVCEALLLPESELAGVRLSRNVFLGRALTPSVSAQTVRLGPDALAALTTQTDPDEIEVPLNDLFRHVLVAGTTGSGKTTRVVEILNRLEDDSLSVIVFETAKRTYREKLQRGATAPLVFMLGGSREYGSSSRFRPLRLNPFFFEVGTSLKRHIAVLSDALAELMPTEAMIGPLMRRAVETTYIERGWDIENGLPLSGTEPAWPTVLDFAVHVRAIAQTLNYGTEVTANYRGALENRASLFLDATFQDIFSHGGNMPVDQMFPPGRDAIIEVEELPPSDVDIRAFVMTLLLSRLRSVQGARNAQVQRQAMCTPTAQVTTRQPVEPTTTIGELLNAYLRGRTPASARRERKRILNSKLVLWNDEQVSVPQQVVGAGDQVQIESRLVWPPVAAAQSTQAKPNTTSSAPQISSLPPAIETKRRRWLVVIEEAHNVLDRALEARRPADESNAGRTLLRCIDRLLQEGREMEVGVMVIDQSPTSLARSVISNTGTKIVMRLEDGSEMEEIGRALGLDEKAWKKIGFLQEGEAIIRASYMDTPVKTSRFARVSAGPSDFTPQQGGCAPSYSAIEALWKPILAAEKRPDQQWLSDLLGKANGQPDLAGFVGLKLQLETEGMDGPVLARTSEFRAAVAQHDLDGADILKTALSAYKSAANSLSHAPLTEVARLMFRALLLPETPPPRLGVNGSGIQNAANVMEAKGLGSSALWQALLLNIATARGYRWVEQCRVFLSACRTASGDGDSAPLRAILLELARRRGVFENPPLRPFDALDVVQLTRDWVEKVTELRAPDAANERLLRERQVKVDRLVHELAIDLATQVSRDDANELSRLLGMDEDHDG